MAKPNFITNFRLSEHAKEEMARRQISQENVADVLAVPEVVTVYRTSKVTKYWRVDA